MNEKGLFAHKTPAESSPSYYSGTQVLTGILSNYVTVDEVMSSLRENRETAISPLSGKPCGADRDAFHVKDIAVMNVRIIILV
ncbi:MAG: hypothetical protein KAR40_00695 [Candidatus Sabulitectum sp.]|nr:hypothetical protein [Candidatus Sabulitectum sp.]